MTTAEHAMAARVVRATTELRSAGTTMMQSGGREGRNIDRSATDTR
jgi:hypothetical protein